MPSPRSSAPPATTSLCFVLPETVVAEGEKLLYAIRSSLANQRLARRPCCLCRRRSAQRKG
jgi:hypothetical protein